MPTLQDVARKAGVSIATVSKVLSNTPYFTEETRQKVMQAVDELGYLPNLAGRALSTGKTGIIAVVFPYVYDRIFKDPLVMHILEGIEAEFATQQYNLLLSTPRLTDKGPDANYERLIRSGYIDGVIAIDNVPLASTSQVASKRGVPVVVIGYHEAKHYVRSDDFKGGHMLMEYILSLGHREIGIITVADDLNIAIAHRVKGLKAAARQAGLNFDALPRYEGDFSTSSGARAITHLLNQDPALSAVISVNDRMAMGAIQQLHAIGKRVPQDMTIVGYDNIAISGIFTPAITTINQRANAQGQAAAHMLFDVLNGKKTPPVVLPPELMVRGSSAVRREPEYPAY